MRFDPYIVAAHPAAEYVKSMIRIAARELLTRGQRRPRQGERVRVERRGLQAEPRRLEAYLRATGGENVAGFRTGDPLLPPLFTTVWEVGLALELMARPGVPSVRGGIVHLESEVLQLRPMRASESFDCRLELERIEPTPRGEELHLRTRTWNGSGQLACESRTVLLARERSAETPAGRRPGERDFHDGAAWRELQRWKLAANHGRKYARASGDYNPIHLSRWTALPFGFRRPILHGFCIEALSAHALIEATCDGDPQRVRRVHCAFRRPLLLPASLRLLCNEEKNLARFRVVDEHDRVLTEGVLLRADPA